MLLVADIGNSNITLGLFKENTLYNMVGFTYEKNMSSQVYSQIFKQILDNIKVSEAAAASVADETTTAAVCDAVREIFNVSPIIITNDMTLGINIKSNTTEKIGIDRIANVCALSREFSEPVIVVDFGTATTFDIMDDEKNFIGGIIMPGIGTQLKSLETNTSKLPHIEVQNFLKVNKTINTDTEKAILTGVVMGHVHAVEGLITDCITQMKKKPILVATGGFAELAAKNMKQYKFDRIDNTLTIRGLQMIYELNND